MSNTYPTIKIVQKDYTRDDGTRNIFIRLTINRKTKYFPLNVFARVDQFKKAIVSKTDPDNKDKNSLIDNYYLKAKKIIFDFRIQDKPLTFNKFHQNFYNSSYGSDSFYDFYVDQVNLLKGKLAPNTIRVYNSQIEKLREFKKEATFNDIDLDFITAYEGFIKKNKSNNQNTVTKSIKCIKSILNRAVDQAIIKDNPIKEYKLKQIQGDREFLSPDELTRLEGLYNKNSLKPNMFNVLRYFLFGCYTGLRYQDIQKLRFRDIQEGKYISIQMIKTKEFVNIPLIEKAKALIPEERFNNQTVFKVLTNQPTNRHLKEIMKAAKINKQISFHCARHTFATISKYQGISYDVISKILGHTDIKTTRIYTRFELDLLTKEMNKWNKE